jgi:hypothetical protein
MTGDFLMEIKPVEKIVYRLDMDADEFRALAHICDAGRTRPLSDKEKAIGDIVYSRGKLLLNPNNFDKPL